jgi:outer membrane protein OmpA-like peptidoglycan-associated protein
MKSIFTVILFGLIYVSASAQDKTDHPALSRYKGAEIVAYKTQDYVPYVLGIDKQEEKKEDFKGHRKYFKEYVDLEGKLTRIQYLTSKSEGLYKVFKNYENALKSAGYEILFSTSNKESSWPFWNETVYHHEWGINALTGDNFEKPFGGEGFHYIAAKGVYKGNNIYFALFINNYDDKIFITQDVIEIKPMETGLVTAKKIEDNIELNGFISIYGIHFDTGKWNIKEKSKPTLKEITTFLNNHKDRKYYIVGHTDNVGEFSSNMMLSEKRAKEVMNTLITEYGVPKEQVKAYGVASLTPVTSNRTDEGKARNRRVVIVEQ